MLLEKIKAKSKRRWHSLTRIFASRSSQSDQLSTTSGRLFVLPYDLLEEIATYLSRQEAALLLTVNSQFHSVFARAVWRELYLNDKLAFRIPASAWQTYGHLVRFATVEYYGLRGHFEMARLPNLIELTLYLRNRGYNILQGAELNNLQRLYLNLPWYGWASLTAVKDVELALRNRRSEHPIAVYWDIHTKARDEVAAIDKILAPIANTAPDSFAITAESKYPVTLEQLPKLAEILTELDLHCPRFVLKCFLGDRSIAFPRLVKLKLRYAVQSEEYADFNVLTPDRFPMLQHLTFDSTSTFSLGWLWAVFSHSWPSLSELFFCNGCINTTYSVIANRVPNLKRLGVNGYTSLLDIDQVIAHLPHLQHLEVDNIAETQYYAIKSPQSQLANLKSFVFRSDREMSEYFIRQHVLSFLLHGAPNLELIELKQSCFHESELNRARGHVNPSVHTLGIEIGLHRFDAATAKMFVGMFPNLKLLKAKGKDYAAIQQLKGDHPNLRIQLY
ncbi:hypothetical protein GQ42DRAFT_180919 [Ramicandelaber brevisporus]|nr:hypothetical protein GQ42DRAFT_180919 [Ramicandelaber brevisporus]